MFKVSDIDRITECGVNQCKITLKDGTEYRLKLGYFCFEFIGNCPEDLCAIDQETINFIDDLYFKLQRKIF